MHKQIDTDDFVHKQRDTDESSPPKKKAKTGKHCVLYLIQVVPGSFHVGNIMGKALDVMKKIFSDGQVTLHAVVIIVREDDKQFTLNKCIFENLSVVNLYTRNSDGVQKLLDGPHTKKKLLWSIAKNVHKRHLIRLDTFT